MAEKARQGLLAGRARQGATARYAVEPGQQVSIRIPPEDAVPAMNMMTSLMGAVMGDPGRVELCCWAEMGAPKRTLRGRQARSSGVACRPCVRATCLDATRRTGRRAPAGCPLTASAKLFKMGPAWLSSAAFDSTPARSQAVLDPPAAGLPPAADGSLGTSCLERWLQTPSRCGVCIFRSTASTMAAGSVLVVAARKSGDGR